jgi:phosphosulfolactate phosphohydrolase-like enzyme
MKLKFYQDSSNGWKRKLVTHNGKYVALSLESFEFQIACINNAKKVFKGLG